MHLCHGGTNGSMCVYIYQASAHECAAARTCMYGRVHVCVCADVWAWLWVYAGVHKSVLTTTRAWMRMHESLHTRAQVRVQECLREFAQVGMHEWACTSGHARVGMHEWACIIGERAWMCVRESAWQVCVNECVHSYLWLPDYMWVNMRVWVYTQMCVVSCAWACTYARLSARVCVSKRVCVSELHVCAYVNASMRASVTVYAHGSVF